jgi:hypothetical protein
MELTKPTGGILSCLIESLWPNIEGEETIELRRSGFMERFTSLKTKLEQN